MCPWGLPQALRNAYPRRTGLAGASRKTTKVAEGHCFKPFRALTQVAFIVGNSEPDSPILTTSDMPGQRPSAGGAETASVLSEAEQTPQCLIPGLPDEMARKCLARVPFWFHARSNLAPACLPGLPGCPSIMSGLCIF